MIDILQYIGVIFVLSGQWYRSCPQSILRSFISTIIGSSCLFMYSFGTAQWGIIILNIVSIILAIRGYINWKKIKVIK